MMWKLTAGCSAMLHSILMNWPNIDPRTTQPTMQKSWRVKKGRTDDLKISRKASSVSQTWEILIQ